VLTPFWLLVKTSTFLAGVTFFCLFPISANFPKYRLLVSPTKRVLWNIPTHAEWAIQYIQAEGLRVLATKQQKQQQQQQQQQQQSPQEKTGPIIIIPEKQDTRDFASYPAHYDKVAGHLVISANGIRFLPKHSPHVVLFSLSYGQICHLEKQDRHVEKVAKILKEYEKDLRIVDCEGREWIVQGMEKRDEMFSQIVGFSRTTWQVVW